MMDSDLKKWAEKTASICLAAPFLKVLRVICINGTDNDNADDGAADDDADNDAEVNADDNATMQAIKDNVDNDAARRQQRRDPDNGLQCKQQAKTQMITMQP
jgi:hypothetical protein